MIIDDLRKHDKIALISVGPRVGKDTLASNLGTHARFAFADNLKLEAGEKFDLDFFDEDVKVKYRDVLIHYGLAARAVDEDYWLNQLLASEAFHDKVIVTDCRFMNEYKKLKKNGYYMVLLVCTPSELQLRGTNLSELDKASEQLWKSVYRDVDLVIDTTNGYELGQSTGTLQQYSDMYL